jgi:imidazole glycerol-phosphate synthase subunit HisH
MNANRSSVTVVNYGAGNILSVTRALSHVGVDVTITAEPAGVATAERILLPGVGAFGKAMDELAKRELIEPLRAYAKSGRPFLGICLGMQLMLDQSEEFGNQEGLGLIAGKVLPIPNVTASGQPHKIPHIGWSALMPSSPDRWQGSLLQGFAQGDAMYFVHSFGAAAESDQDCLAVADYNGQTITAAVERDNLTGIQCHPEKSGPAGLLVLKNFVNFGGPA